MAVPGFCGIPERKLAKYPSDRFGRLESSHDLANV